MRDQSCNLFWPMEEDLNFNFSSWGIAIEELSGWWKISISVLWLYLKSFPIPGLQFPKNSVRIQLPVSEYRVSSFRIPVSEYHFRVSEYHFRVSEVQFPNATFQFPNTSIRIPVSECHLQFPNTTCQFPNTTCQFPNTTVTLLLHC